MGLPADFRPGLELDATESALETALLDDAKLKVGSSGIAYSSSCIFIANSSSREVSIMEAESSESLISVLKLLFLFELTDVLRELRADGTAKEDRSAILLERPALPFRMDSAGVTTTLVSGVSEAREALRVDTGAGD
jgi:hypothetical protein